MKRNSSKRKVIDNTSCKISKFFLKKTETHASSTSAEVSRPEINIDRDYAKPSTSSTPDLVLDQSIEEIGVSEDFAIARIEEIETTCEPTVLSPDHKTKKKYNQKYVKAWENLTVFKGWLCQYPGKPSDVDTAFCKVCDQKITCGKSEILRHADSKRHVSLMKSCVSTPTINQALSCTTAVDISSRRGELKWASMLAEKNLPISLMDTIIPLAANIYKDSKIAANMKCKRTKTSKLLKNVLAPDFKNKLCNKLKNSKFSLIMDETTDVGSVKQCAFSVVFWDEEMQKINTEFLHMVECTKGDAESLFELLKNTLLENEIPIQNMVGFCSDTTNVMAGNNNSVFTKLKKELPQICLLKCSSHQLHLASSWACKKIPNEIEDMLRNIYAHFHRSFQRQVVLQEFQEFYETEPHKILRSSQTRWLSLKECVNRVIEQLEPLKGYFMTEVFEDSTGTTESILFTLNKKSTKCYLYFLSYVLDLLTGLNVLFQTDGPVMFRLKPEVEKLIKDISMNFLNVQYVRESDPWKIDPFDETLYLEKENVYLGLQAHQEIMELKEEGNLQDAKNVYEHCLNFYIILVNEIQKRFDFSDNLFNFIKILDPKQAQQMSVPTLKPVFDRFSLYFHNLSYQNVDSQWRQHAILNHIDYKLTIDLKLEEYWSRVFNLKNSAGQLMFSELKEVINLLMCLPASNASIERLFSQLKLIKTVHRNKLDTSTICSLIHTKQGVKDCINFEPSKEMLNKKWKDLN